MGLFAKYLLQYVEGSWVPQEDEYAVEIPCAAIKARTDAAVLIVSDGQELWIPKSQLDIIDDGKAWISPWMARNL